MRRRAFVAGLGTAAAVWPSWSVAQGPSSPVIGFLSSRSANESARLIIAFQKGLQTGSGSDRQAVTVKYRWAGGHLETAFKKIADQGTRTLVILGDPLFTLHRRALIERAALARLATICGTRDYSEAGCLLSYGPSYFEASKRAATYVRKILEGAQPGELPVQQPTKFDLIVNLKTAAALGLTIPPTLLARADEVIE